MTPRRFRLLAADKAAADKPAEAGGQDDTPRDVPKIANRAAEPASERPDKPVAGIVRPTFSQIPVRHAPETARLDAPVARPEPALPPSSQDTGPGMPENPSPAPEAVPAEAKAVPTAGDAARRVSVEVLTPDSARRVTLDMVERRGQVHVAVRSEDPGLTTSLRQELPHLVTRLEQSGYAAEPWSRGGSGQLDTPQREAPPQPGGDQRERRPQPEWLDEFQPKRQNRSEENFAWHLRSIGTT
jgi:hypothetical protein